MTWPKLFMWDTEYANWTDKLFKHSTTKVLKTSAIWYSDSKLNVQNTKNKKNIILFDVSPAKLSSLLPMGNYPLYRTYGNSVKFLDDIYLWAIHNNFNIIWKKKRNKSIHSNIKYWAYSELFASKPGVILIDSNVSPHKLINEFNSPVISAPFTSTAFIAKELGAPSFFYDPTKTLFKTDRGCQGVKLLSGFDELDNMIDLLKG
jgi:polysaccharide biosynthesis PFTS motif protein